MKTDSPAVRPAMQAGRFYDADPQRLRSQIERFLSECRQPPADSPPLALLAPHAGYVYSGRIAACAYRQIQGAAIDCVIILAPSHYVEFEGAALPSHDAFATPLGDVRIDRQAVDALLKEPWFQLNDEAHACEHAVEVQIPFLQVTLREGFSIVPLTLGRCDEPVLDSLTDSLGGLIDARRTAGRRWLIVASSDTYHGYDRAACDANDQRLIGLIEAMRTAELRDQARQRKVMACGWMPLALAMGLAQRAGVGRVRLLAQANSQSGQSSPGDYVVGYLAAALG
jgi:hypothetical protein